MKIEIEVQRPVLSKFKFKFGTRVKFLNPESTKILELAVEQRNKLKPNLNLRQPPLPPAQTLSCFLMVQLVVKSLKLPGDLSGCSRNKSNISQLVWAIANLPRICYGCMQTELVQCTACHPLSWLPFLLQVSWCMEPGIELDETYELQFLFTLQWPFCRSDCCSTTVWFFWLTSLHWKCPLTFVSLLDNVKKCVHFISIFACLKY